MGSLRVTTAKALADDEASDEPIPDRVKIVDVQIPFESLFWLTFNAGLCVLIWGLIVAAVGLIFWLPFAIFLRA